MLTVWSTVARSDQLRSGSSTPIQQAACPTTSTCRPGRLLGSRRQGRQWSMHQRSTLPPMPPPLPPMGFAFPLSLLSLPPAELTVSKKRGTPLQWTRQLDKKRGTHLQCTRQLKLQVSSWDREPAQRVLSQNPRANNPQEPFYPAMMSTSTGMWHLNGPALPC